MKSIKKFFTKMSIVLMSFVIAYDFLLNSTFEKPLFWVSENYIYYIFAAHASVAVLSITLIAIIVSNFSEKQYGFTLKEVINFRSVHQDLNFEKFVSNTLISILISGVLLAFECVNSVSVLFGLLVVNIVRHNKYIWKIVSQEEYCFGLIKNHILTVFELDNVEEKNIILNKLFNDYSEKIRTKNVDESDEVLELIYNSLLKMQSILIPNSFFDFIERAFRESIHGLGFCTAIEKTFSINNQTNLDFIGSEKIRIICNEIDEIRYLSDFEFTKHPAFKLYMNLPDVTILNQIQYTYLEYTYFENVYKNQLLSHSFKEEQISLFIDNLCTFSYIDEADYNKSKRDTIRKIVSKFIIENGDLDKRERLFNGFVESLYKSGFASGTTYYQSLSITYLMIYFHGFHEKDTISEEHRKNIKALISCSKESIDKFKVNFRSIVENYSNGLVPELFNYVRRIGNYASEYEYFPKNKSGKSVVWRADRVLKFALANYVIFWSKQNSYDFIDNWTEWEDYDSEIKTSYLLTMKSLFDYNTELFKQDFLDYVNTISSWLNVPYTCDDYFMKKLFKAINDIHVDVLAETKQQVINHEMSFLNNKINLVLDERMYFGKNVDMSFTDDHLIVFESELSSIKSINNEKNTVRRVVNYIEHEINKLMFSKLDKVELSSNLGNIEKVIKLLRKYQCDISNYPSQSLIELFSRYENNEKYTQLTEILKSVEYSSLAPINYPMFIKNNNFEFNFRIKSYEIRELTSGEVDEVVERFMTSNGIYLIEGAIHTKEEAKPYIKENYRIRTMSIYFRKKLKRNSGFIISKAD